MTKWRNVGTYPMRRMAREAGLALREGNCQAAERQIVGIIRYAQAHAQHGLSPAAQRVLSGVRKMQDRLDRCTERRAR